MTSAAFSQKQKLILTSILAHAWCDTCIFACVHVFMWVGVLECPAQMCEVLIWSRLLADVKILLQVFIIASVWNSGSVVCAARVGGVMECLRVWRDSGRWADGGGCLPSLTLCFPPASPRPVAHCTLGNGEAYWSWLVPAGSQIEFWQAGETSSQRDPPLPPHTPVLGTMGNAGEGLFKQLQLHSTPLLPPGPKLCYYNYKNHTTLLHKYSLYSLNFSPNVCELFWLFPPFFLSVHSVSITQTLSCCIWW